MTSRCSPRLLLAAVLLAGLAVTAHAQAVRAVPVAYSGSKAVGEVTLSVGPAVRTSAQGLPEGVTRGSKIMAGDRLDTAEGGMIHIRFVDGAMVSVRPGSRLWVEDYRYDAQNVAQSLVRFRLEHGVARAISGAAAEGAKERFRLNTPLVAIGVRGTDFVVHTGADATTATVNQGAIVMAPFDAGCLAQALGPCGSPAARLLSADMGQLLVEFRPQLAQPEIRPMYPMSASRGAETSEPGNRAAGTLPNAPARSAQAASDEVVSTALVKDLVQTTATPKLPDPPIVVPSVPTEPAVPVPPAQLQWGRWGGEVFPGGITVPRAEAAEGRTVTVGDDNNILYRINNGQGALSAGLGSYSFDLKQSQAMFSAPGQALAQAFVKNGTLDINFGAARFATTLNVHSAPTGTVGIAGSGFVRSDGIFVDRSVPGTAIAGATSLDGKSAGYLFEKAVGAGTLSGITLWSRP